MSDKIKWACPRCEAPYGFHGKGKCRPPGSKRCHGLCCECESPGANRLDHGETENNACTKTECTHCGWKGTMPAAGAMP